MVYKQKVTLVLFIFLFLKEVKSQEVNEKSFGLQVGYTYQGLNRIDLGVNYLFVKRKDYKTNAVKRDNDSLPEYKSEISKKSIQSSGLNISVHGFFNGSDFIQGQSIGYSLGKAWNNGFGFNSGLGVFHYSHNDLRISPSVGISFAEVFYLNYSYAIPINNKEQTFIAANQIGLVIRYNRAILQALFNSVR